MVGIYFKAKVNVINTFDAAYFQEKFRKISVLLGNLGCGAT